MSVQIIRGDLLEADADIICHQVNCQGVMGAGVAKQIADKWPYVKKEYVKFCNSKKLKQNLLGEVQLVAANGGFQQEGDPLILNIFGQLYYGHDGVYTDYSALTKAFRKMNQLYKGKTLAFPYGFGCGLAGGDWQDVEPMLVRLLPDCDVKIYLKG